MIAKFDTVPFKVGDLIQLGSSGELMMVAKVYKYTRWRKFLYRWFKIKYKHLNCVKFEKIKYDGEL